MSNTKKAAQWKKVSPACVCACVCVFEKKDCMIENIPLTDSHTQVRVRVRLRLGMCVCGFRTEEPPTTKINGGGGGGGLAVTTVFCKTDVESFVTTVCVLCVWGGGGGFQHSYN